MNAAHFHLVVNHFPLFVALFGGALLAWGLYTERETLAKAGLVLAILTGIGAFVATQSGERAEGLVEGLPGVVESTIEAHEEAGEAAQWASIGLAVLALAALVTPARLGRLKRAAMIGSLVMALVAFGLVARAANLGGLIRHPEISDASVASSDGDRHDEDDESD